MANPKCAIFISDVGFGHMVRQRQIIFELLKQFNKISITVFHMRNIQVLKKSFGNKIRYVKNFNNIALCKTPSGLLDISNTKKQIASRVRVCVQINNLLSQPLILHSQTPSK